MPKTKFQEIVFTLFMVVFMVYAMVVYNITLTTGGLTDGTFLIALHELPLMGLIAFLVEMFIVGNVAKMIAFRTIDPREEKGYVITFFISCATVCLMCPIMSLIATILFSSPGQEMFSRWITTTALNFPMALLSQLFLCGPLVRLIFSQIFKTKSLVEMVN